MVAEAECSSELGIVAVRKGLQHGDVSDKFAYDPLLYIGAGQMGQQGLFI